MVKGGTFLFEFLRQISFILFYYIVVFKLFKETKLFRKTVNMITKNQRALIETYMGHKTVIEINGTEISVLFQVIKGYAGFTRVPVKPSSEQD